MISSSAAYSLTKEWMKGQEDLSSYAYPIIRAYEPELQGRKVAVRVMVRFGVTQEVKQFNLVHLVVTDRETIEVIKDRRPHVRDLTCTAEHEFIKRTSHRQGFNSFDSFCRVVKPMTDAPEWVEKVDLDDSVAGKHNYDCWVHILTLSGKPARVPVRVFETAREQARYCKRKTAIQTQRMVSLVVHAHQTEAEIRERLYYLLQQIRDHKVYR